MIDIIVLAGFVYLVIRVANSIFNTLDRLTTRKQEPKPVELTDSKKKERPKKDPIPEWMKAALSKQLD